MKDLHIVITDHCNINCTYCYNKYYNNMKKEMDFELYKNIINFAKKMDIENIFLTGGEPTLHSNLLNMIKYAHDQNLNVSLTTNGKLLNKNKIIELEESGLKGIAFSLDSLTVEGHDQVRRGSSYKDVWEKVLFTKNNTNMKLNIISVINDKNIRYVKELFVEAVKNGILIVPQPCFDLSQNNPLFSPLSNKEKNELINIIKVWGKYVDNNYSEKIIQYLGTGNYECRRCKNYSNIVVVDCEGDVRNCFLGTPVFGNIRDTNIHEKYLKSLDLMKDKCIFATKKCLPMEFSWYE